MDNRHQKNGVVYHFDTLNQLSSLQYDTNGNPISMGNAFCTYDALDRLISLETSGTLLHFTYDFDHRRLSKTVYTKILDAWQKVGAHSYFYDKRNEIGAFDSRGNLVEFRILNPTQESDIGSSIAFDLSGELYIPLHDVSGNVVATVSQKTGFLQTIQLSAFGEESNTSSLIPWRFSSKRLDPESGLYNFGRRYYDPQLGRWLTPDPAGYDEGANLYAFVGNNPLTHSDPYGLWVGPTWSVPPISITTPWVSPKRDEVSAAVVHAAAHASLTTATMANTAVFLVTTPARTIYNWTTGSSTFSRDWDNLSRYHQALINTGMDRVRQWYPADTSSSTYQWTYSAANLGLEASMICLEAMAIAKGIYTTVSASLRLYGHLTRSSQRAVLSAERLVASTANKIPTPIRIGRGKNRFVPDPAATTAHSRFRYDPPSSKISHYETFQPQTNPFDPKPWESVKRFDNLTGNHHSHFNKVLKQEIFEPHVHDPTYPGGVRHPFFWEIPK